MPAAKHTNTSAVLLGRLGGRARARVLTPERRREIAKAAAQARWARRKKADAETNHGADS